MVDLPAPLEPARATNSPFSILKLRPGIMTGPAGVAEAYVYEIPAPAITSRAIFSPPLEGQGQLPVIKPHRPEVFPQFGDPGDVDPLFPEEAGLSGDRAGGAVEGDAAFFHQDDPVYIACTAA